MFYWKNKQKALYAVVVLSTCLTGCVKTNQESALYPIDSIIDSQTTNLAAAKAKLYKEVSLGAKIDTATFIPADSIAWGKELDVFRQLDEMNKPANRQRYVVDDNLFDPGSNLTVKAITGTGDLPVKSMRIYFSASARKPRKIEAVYQERNALYGSERMLTMEFQQINNKNTLTSYSISGGQRIVLDDTVSYWVKGKIRIH